MTVLDLLANHHHEWVKMAHSFGAGDYAEDVVQEMYIRLSKYVSNPERIMYGEEPNKLFVWVTLRNMVRNIQNKKAHIVYVDEIQDFDSEVEQFDNAEAEAFEKLVDEVWEKSKDLHWYERKMFEIYYSTPMSMRDIARETGISLFSVFDTIRKARNFIIDEKGEDYEDYKSGDYEKI